MIVQGADPNYFHEEKRSTPLHVAAKFGQASQIELLLVYGANTNAVDGNGLTPVEVAKINNHNLIAERLIEATYEVTDRLTEFIGLKKPDHSSGKHLNVPDPSQLNISEPVKIARGKLQLIPNKIFEELVMDIYDEVDRRENEASKYKVIRKLLLDFLFKLITLVWSTTVLQPESGCVPFLPSNPYLSAIRNQGRQKLARLNNEEFQALIMDVLVDARRRQNLADLAPCILPHNNRESNLSDDEPLYDAVASDDEVPFAEQVRLISKSLQKFNSFD